MNASRICPACGAPLEADLLGGLCPQCLLQTRVLGASAAPAGPGGASARKPAPGEFFGGYRVLRLLGRGGMGEVYEAEQADTGRRVALKVMNHGLSSETDRKRFLREGRLAAAVAHPNVIYVYGSEEIEGAPVIAMELVGEGTLKDLVRRRGPLPPAEAVDLILQAIAGLDAARAAGVLHRDVKPANCFLGADGVVKVGDFGLSISTQARGESILTASGSMIGTPGFASPEQLRGEALDVRSDIYSVGATLYFLLTGRQPFEAEDLVQLITLVLDRPSASPVVHRPGLSAGLCRVVLRCLAKERAARCASYEELRKALLPFSGRAPKPALLGLRFVAGAIDSLVLAVPGLIAFAVWGVEEIPLLAAERGAAMAVLGWSLLLFPPLYYAIMEGRWGAGLGKACCGLKVVARAGGVPGVARAAGRALLFGTSASVPLALAFLVYSREELLRQTSEGSLLLTDWAWIPLSLLLFASVRRANGFAGLHELASGTRTVLAPSEEQRPRDLVAEPPVVVPATAPRLGPYAVLATLSEWDDQTLLLAYDEALRRKVWIHRQPAGTPAVGARRRDLGRPGRLRWLNGGREATGAWDAYAAPEGQAWLSATAQPRPWSVVRFWLLDLAEEFHAGLRHESLAELFAADRLWVTPAGHALVLDFRAPGVHESDEAWRHCGADPASFCEFLDHVAVQSLSGSAPAPSAPALPPPSRAQRFLQSLAGGGFDAIEVLLGNLRSLVQQRAAPEPWQRLSATALAVAPVLVVAGVVALTAWSERARWDRAWNQAFPGRASIRPALTAAEAWNTIGQPDNFFLFLAARYGDVLTNAAFWANPHLGGNLSEGERQTITNALTAHSRPDPVAAQKAEAVVRLHLDQYKSGDASALLMVSALVGAAWVFGCFLCSMMLTLALGHPPLLRAAGLAVMTRRGEPASRLRLLGRGLAGWGPWVALSMTAAIALGWAEVNDQQARVLPVLAWIVAPAGALTLGALIRLARHPAQGWHDRLAGVCVLPR